MTEIIQSDISIEEASIFDTLAQSITKELDPKEMTRGRFAEKYRVTLHAAIVTLEKAVKDGKLKKEKRISKTDVDGRYIWAYIPVE